MRQPPFVTVTLQCRTHGTRFRATHHLPRGHAVFDFGTDPGGDIVLPAAHYPTLAPRVGRVDVTLRRARLTCVQAGLTRFGEPFTERDLMFGGCDGCDLTFGGHDFRLSVVLFEPDRLLRYRIHHPADPRSSSSRRSALIDVAVSEYGSGNVVLEGDAEVIALAERVVESYPDGLISTYWLSEVRPSQLHAGLRHPWFVPFDPELISGANLLDDQVPSRRFGAEAPPHLADLLAQLVIHTLPGWDPRRGSERDRRHLAEEIWGWQRWRPGPDPAEDPFSEADPAEIAPFVAAAIARRNPAIVADERYLPGRVPLVDRPVTQAEAAALTAAFIAALDLASNTDPDAFALDLRARVQALGLVDGPRPAIHAPAFLRLVEASPGVVVEGMGADGRFALTQTAVLGRRPDCDLIVRGAVIGGQKNCQFRPAASGTWIFRHLGSSLPALVNGEDLGTTDHRLAHGDTIQPVTADGKTLRFVFEQE